MIRHKLPNKTKNATVAEPKLFHHLNDRLAVFASAPASQRGKPQAVEASAVSRALNRFQNLTPKFTMQNSYFPSYQNVGTYMEY
jgi:hypothetical protein